MKGLIVADPWISHILTGTKTWEMRSERASYRGAIALIRKGTGSVVGLANLVDVLGPFTKDELSVSFGYHRVPIEQFVIGEQLRWNVAWVLRDAETLLRPVPYKHQSGAVKWVNLPAATARAISAERRLAQPPGARRS